MATTPPFGSWVDIPADRVLIEMRNAAYRIANRISDPIYQRNDFVAADNWVAKIELRRGQATLVVQRRQPISSSGQFFNIGDPIEIPAEGGRGLGLTFRSYLVYDTFRKAGVSFSADFAREFPGQAWIRPDPPLGPPGVTGDPHGVTGDPPGATGDPPGGIEGPGGGGGEGE